MSDAWTNDAPAAPAATLPKAPWEMDAPASGVTPQQKAVVQANDNAEEAARAFSVSKKLAVPAPVVQSDLPGYNAQERTNSAKRAAENPAVQRYIQGNPIAASASADDWDGMEEASAALRLLHPELMARKVNGGLIAAVPEIANLAGTPQGREKLYGALTQLPKALAEGIVDFFKTPGDVASGKIDLTTAEGLDKGISFGIGVSLGGRDIRVGKPARVEVRGGEFVSFDEFMAHVRGFTTRAEIDAFLKEKADAGGPPGAMLQITKAEAGAEALSKAVEVAQNSKTKTRSPDLFAEFGNAHDAGSVHIDAAKVLELYQAAGKVPAAGDGLFGFVPDLAAKAEAAAATGGELTIPVGQYIAHVDPAVHEGLRTSVRLHDDGVTLEEAKEAQASIEAWHGTPHDFERFDLTKIGTGEGAQSYGHGLYFAENRTVAADYQSKLSPDGRLAITSGTYNGISVNQANPMELANALELGEARYPFSYALSALTSGKSLGEAIALIREQYSDNPGLQKAIDALNEHQPRYEPGKGSLYKVSINADPTKFLDWDLPLSQQSEHVRAALKKLGIPEEGIGLDAYGKAGIPKEILDPDVARVLSSPANRDIMGERASKALLEAGIPGIKYLDQGSRDKGSTLAELQEAVDGAKAELARQEKRVRDNPTNQTFREDLEIIRKELIEAEKDLAKGAPELTRNFVVFDDKLVKITEKNGNPVVDAAVASTEQQKKVLYLNGLFKDAASVGLTEAEFAKYSDKIERAEAYVLERAIKLNRSRIAESVSAEWKRNEAAVRDEVTRELTDTGAFAAERYLRQQGIDIAHERAAEVADDLAPLFGFETGQDLLRGLESIEIERAASKKGPQAQLRDAIKERTAALMEERYGRLAENIAQEAREIALADHSFDIMAEEVSILAKLAKSTPPLTRSEMVVWAKEQFENTLVADAANYEKLSRAVAKGGREAEKALLKGDFVEAFQAKQRQMLAAVLAKESLALQRLIDRTEAKIDRFTSEPTIKSIDQGHLEQIREMLAAVGIPQVHAPSAPPMELRDFVAASDGQLAVAPWLYEGRTPRVTEMNVQEFREFADSLKSMEHVGRQAQKLFSAHGEAELQNVIFDVNAELARFGFVDQPTWQNMSLGQKARSVGRRIIGAHLLVERMLDYTDKFHPEGPLTKWLDRPLRDANVKELQLTEQVTQMIRDMYGLTDASTLELIPNNLIPDAMSKSGFMQMTRQNLREVMLNMGNFSNIKKLSEGFGINEADLRRFVDQHATAKDVAYVNAVWKIFKHLKPEADAVMLRDTGVPVDTIPAVPWDIKAGALEGGYYPLVYDKYNSDIVGHRARQGSLFDQNYVSASTPHGYTQARTEYKGALDLTGAFLSGRIQSMIHDIAFREAVRNANKLISNQEFRTAMAQRWGKEYADLIPGWLKDIANSHNLDDAYAQGFARSMALIRQNVVSTLIAFNPSTVIKHGFTAALMSAERVGFVDLAKATKELGIGDAWETAKDLARRGEPIIPDADYIQAMRDALDQGERGESVRNFVLQSSAVMRNRSRQVDDSIRGAIDKLNQAGVTGFFKTLRERNIHYGRLAVAFSDQMSAVPTWWAAYRQAFEEGVSHEDAVFRADKEVSRAHGSQFTGDQPMVTRIPNGFAGEVAKLFTPLYKFYNHFANNNFQFVWDANAALKGNPTGEPGANAARLARHIGVVLLTLFIEEQATAALDKDKKGFLHSMLMKSLHLFGGQFIGLREVTNGLSHGYGPASGLLGTVWKAGEETVKDIAKESGIKAGVAKNAIKNTATTLGFMTGLGGAQIGRTGQFLANVARGRERPRTQSEWRQGLRTGSMKARVH
jgi:hypothetical protein